MLTIPLLALALFASWLMLKSVMRRRAYAAQWHVVTRTLVDGSRRVELAGPGGKLKIVTEFPASLDGIALEDALRDARSQAFAEAMRLNEPVPAPAPAPRIRS